MEIPKTKVITLSDAERFIEGLKMLVTECNATNIEYNGFGPLRFYFEDGTEVGSIRAFINAGYIDEKEYKRKYERN